MHLLCFLFHGFLEASCFIKMVADFFQKPLSNFVVQLSGTNTSVCSVEMCGTGSRLGIGTALAEKGYRIS